MDMENSAVNFRLGKIERFHREKNARASKVQLVLKILERERTIQGLLIFSWIKRFGEWQKYPRSDTVCGKVQLV